jgi:hypothetical protein
MELPKSLQICPRQDDEEIVSTGVDFNESCKPIILSELSDLKDIYLEKLTPSIPIF